ncbi:Hypothetical predicted protein [Podarcis lilfordi]|uniref:Uncharacterized protein n=1 Tax=Podarcis lilfordi TaxID=74358 RepID=A0AA35JU62_9SAUR|nr:Hypothetical predicted protein [Podarcis lilfordi]
MCVAGENATSVRWLKNSRILCGERRGARRAASPATVTAENCLSGPRQDGCKLRLKRCLSSCLPSRSREHLEISALFNHQAIQKEF